MKITKSELKNMIEEHIKLVQEGVSTTTNYRNSDDVVYHEKTDTHWLITRRFGGKPGPKGYKIYDYKGYKLEATNEGFKAISGELEQLPEVSMYAKIEKVYDAKVIGVDPQYTTDEEDPGKLSYPKLNAIAKTLAKTMNDFMRIIEDEDIDNLDEVLDDESHNKFIKAMQRFDERFGL